MIGTSTYVYSIITSMVIAVHLTVFKTFIECVEKLVGKFIVQIFKVCIYKTVYLIKGKNNAPSF